jgi:hypothetical protein
VSDRIEDDDDLEFGACGRAGGACGGGGRLRAPAVRIIRLAFDIGSVNVCGPAVGRVVLVVAMWRRSQFLTGPALIETL